MLRHQRNKHIGSTETDVSPPPKVAYESKSLPSPPPPQLQLNYQQTQEYEKMNAVSNNQKIEEENATLFHPFSMMVSGPTGCGKTYLMKQLLHRVHDLCKPSPQRGVWLLNDGNICMI